MGLVRVITKAGQEGVSGLFIGDLKAFEEFKKGGQNLVGQFGRDFILELAALFEYGMQALLGGECVDALMVEKFFKGGTTESARGFEQGINRKGDVAGGLVLGFVDNAEGLAVDNQTDGHAGIVQETFKLLLWSIHPPDGVEIVLRLAVKFDIVRNHQAQNGIGRAAGFRGPAFRPAIGKVGFEGVVAIGFQNHFEIRRHRIEELIRASVRLR